MQFDYAYLCRGLGHLTGLEVRVYLGGELTERYQPSVFEPDIARLVEARLPVHPENVFYLETEDLLLFGVVRSKGRDKAVIIIGPTAQTLPGNSEGVAVLHQLGESYGRLPELLEYFGSMVPYPLENFLGILVFLNYALNGEKLTAADLIFSGRDAFEPPPAQREADAAADPRQPEAAPHNTYEMERQMLSYVAAGNTEAIAAFIQAPAAGRIGTLAQSELRQRKNAFIVATTLICRAAIAGGLPTQTAFALSDRYIQKAELLKTGRELTLLNVELLTDYTRRVNDLKYGLADTPLARSVMRYIRQNLGQKIATADIAVALGINRQHLCQRFKQETGLTIGECVTGAKLDEGKRLLESTDLSVAQISEYLAFSSQSYFQTVFKRATGCTPKAYRKAVSYTA